MVAHTAWLLVLRVLLNLVPEKEPEGQSRETVGTWPPTHCKHLSPHVSPVVPLRIQ